MRKASVVISTMLLAAGLAGCGGSGSDSGDGGDEPIKIAIVAPTNGSLAEVGKQALSAWKLAVEEANKAGGVGGRKVELVTMESDGQPANTVRSVRQAVTQKGADFVGGVTTSPEVAAVNQQLTALNVLSFSATAQDDSLTGSACSPNSFQTTPSVTMLLAAITSQLDSLDASKWAILVPDYSTGHTVADLLTTAVEDKGEQVVSTQFAPQGTTDYSSFITKMTESGADALFVQAQGADGVAFVKQATQFQAFDSLKTVLGFNTFYRFSLAAMGDGVVGKYANLPYDVSADNALNQDFVKAYTAANGDEPDYVQAFNYLAAETLFAGIEKAGSTDTDKVREALDGLTYDSIVGSVTMRPEDHQLIMPSSLGEITQDGDDFGYDVIGTAGADTVPAPSGDCAM